MARASHALGVSSGAFRALQVWERSSQMEHLPPGAPWATPFLPDLGNAPCLPMELDTKLCEDLAFNGALLPSSLQRKPETVENPGE